MPSPRVIKTFFYTVAVTTITIGGTLYGADLKTRREARKINEKRERATVDEKIEALKTARAALVAKRFTVEKQLQELEAKIEEKKRKNMRAPTSTTGTSTSTDAAEANDQRSGRASG